MLAVIDNPPVLPPTVSRLAELGGPWWVAHTRSRFEKAFAWELLHAGIGYFLPLIDRVTVSSGKKRKVLAPLFPSYVFFCGDAEERYAALRTNRLCQVIPVLDQHRLVGQLSAIERAMDAGVHLDAYGFAAVGQECRVAKGPLQGLQGPVVRRGDTTRLVLEVSALGQVVSLEIDADLLEPVG